MIRLPAYTDPLPKLTPDEVTLYNNGIDACFQVLGDEVYEVGLDEQQKMLREDP